MAPLQSCLLGQTKPLSEKISKIGQKRNGTIQKTELAILAIFRLSPMTGAQSIRFKVFNQTAKL